MDVADERNAIAIGLTSECITLMSSDTSGGDRLTAQSLHRPPEGRPHPAARRRPHAVNAPARC